MESILNLASGFKKLIDDLKIYRIFRSNYLKNDRLLNGILFLLILYGLSLKFQLSMSISLNSDNVLAGLVCREAFEHGNYFLQGYYLPSADPYIFSDIILFHLLPQLLTRYDPKALALSSYFIYVAVIITYSVLIYDMTKNIKNSLIFASLLANIPNNAGGAYYFFECPTNHISTIFFIGILLLIYRRNIHERLSAAFYLLVLALISFSDSLLILWYFIPFIVTHTLLNRPFELRKMRFSFISVITVLLVYLVKESIQTFIRYPISLITSKGLIFENVLLFFKGICLLYNNELCEFSNTYELNIHVMIVIIITIGIIYFVFSNISKTFSMNPVWWLFVFLSITLSSIIYVFTTMPVNIYTTRYLTFPLILSISILALVYSQNMKFQRVYLFLVFSLIIINAGSNTELLKGGHEQPNREQYELIDFLKESNLTLGYGNYWDSNIITYLSKEEIVIRPVIFTDAKIIPYRWLSCERWFTEKTKISEIFIIQSDFQNKEIENFVRENPPKKILEFRNYKIYVWDVKN